MSGSSSTTRMRWLAGLLTALQGSVTQSRLAIFSALCTCSWRSSSPLNNPSPVPRRPLPIPSSCARSPSRGRPDPRVRERAAGERGAGCARARRRGAPGPRSRGPARPRGGVRDRRRGPAIEAPLAGIKRGEAETGTKVGLIVCGIRTRSPTESLELARAAAEYRSAGVVAFDLAGAERGFPARDHAGAFAYAAQHGMACTCHAGEGDGPDSIHQALHACGARRIGHGTRLGEDAALLEYVIEHRIPLEMCLTSNLHTHTVASLAEHPFKRYFDRAVVVTLNTDGRLVDGGSLTDADFLAHTVGGLAQEDLARVALNACESAFLPEFE